MTSLEAQVSHGKSSCHVTLLRIFSDSAVVTGAG